LQYNWQSYVGLLPLSDGVGNFYECNHLGHGELNPPKFPSSFLFTNQSPSKGVFKNVIPTVREDAVH